MKLRIQDNSIRLRLTRTEVERVSSEGRVDATVSFPDGRRLTYALQASPDASPAEAVFADDQLVVRVAEAVLQEWAATDRVSIEAEQPLPREAMLKILVEKDFACLTPREGEDESEMFPHPLKGTETC